MDHHVHVHSPTILAFLPDYCESVRRFGKCDPAFTAPLAPEDLLAQLDRAGIRRALVMSTGYLAESSMISPARPDGAALLRAANDWTVALARRYPKRLSAFIAVDPTTPTALPEIARWRGNPAVTGLKLHLTSAGVDLRRDADVTALAATFRAAAEAKLAVMIHLRTRAGDYGARDVQRFLTEVLPAAGSTPVQIAHAGGWGGIDKATLAALGAFADAIEAEPKRFRNVWFDLAGVWTKDTAPGDRDALVALIRRIGPAHFLPASDWPFTGDLADYYGRIYPLLPLTQAEWKRIRSNVAPYARP
ncbi:amidohydrolase family protein [Aggregicoccus sp. 17bor-14]|uniref:amidohydrolase family protein n=1 Tax=Myxococcaceae TaxID=31 RepID=UPI003519ECBA